MEFHIIIINNRDYFVVIDVKEVYNMKKVLAIALTTIAAAIGTIATTGCIIVLIDEPEMPDSLL